MKKLLIISIGLMLIISCRYISEDDLNPKDQDHANIIYADSLSKDDIQTAVDSASNGDTVILPEGTNNNFSGTVWVPGGIEIRGQGKDKTILKLGTTQTFALFIFDSNDVARETNCSGFTIYGTGDGSKMERGIRFEEFANCIVRIWDMEFYDCNTEAVYIQGWPIQACVWNVKVYNSNYDGHGYGIYVDGRNRNDAVKDGDYSWSQALGLGGSNAVYIEDCHLEKCRHHIDGCFGGRYVVRHNTIIGSGVPANAVINIHGLTETFRGLRSFEVYENIIDFITDQYGFYIHTGDGVVFNNTMTGISYIPWSFMVRHNYCDSGGDYPLPDQMLDTYLWGNIVNGLSHNTLRAYHVCTGYFEKDRDWYEYEKPKYTPYIYPHPLRWRDFPLNAEINASSTLGWRPQTVLQIAFSNFPHIFRQRIPIKYPGIL